MKKVLSYSYTRKTPHIISSDGHRYPYQMENAIKCDGLFFFNITLGLNSLPVSCVWRGQIGVTNGVCSHSFNLSLTKYFYMKLIHQSFISVHCTYCTSY